jgi:phosphate transport system permease protein
MIRYRFLNNFYYYLAIVCTIIVIFIFAGIFVSLVQGGLPAFKKFGFHFLIDPSWDPVHEKFGALTSILGTLISSFIALLIAIPFSFSIAIFIHKLAPQWAHRYIRVAVDLLAGIPSIIYGMWGLFALAPVIGKYVQPWCERVFEHVPFIKLLFGGSELGIGLFTAGVVLATMVIPFIASVMYDVLEAVPAMLQESAYALGATTAEVIWKVMLPYGRLGFLAGIMLGLGRALGETMAVAFVIGNAHTMTTTLFEPANSAASTMANEFTEATGKIYTASLIELALYLFLMTALVIFLSRLLLKLMQDKSAIQTEVV